MKQSEELSAINKLVSDPYMGSMEAGDQKPHAVCITVPGQSHMKAMLKLAKLLHHSGFHITFVNTELSYNRYLESLGQDSLNDLPSDFQFKTIGLPPSAQDTLSNIDSIRRKMCVPFCELIRKLNDQSVVTPNTTPLVTHIVSDGFMPFTIKAGEELGIPVVLFFTISASVFMAYEQLPALMEKLDLPPTKDNEITNEFLDTVIDWIPGMKDMRVRDLPSFCWTVSTRDHILFNFCMEAAATAHMASAVIVHTFYALEHDIMDALSSMLPRVFATGPLELLLNRMPAEDPLKHLKYSLWKEESECLQWLDTKEPRSVVYVNFGSMTVMSLQHLVEFGMGLANSKHHFLWIIRPDLVVGESATLPPEFVNETKGRGLISSWCPQEEVLNHSSIGGFLTHSGWNSTIESLSYGVPMLCWPFFGDQPTNCRYTCKEWGVGMEIDKDVKRDEVEKLVRELMEGEKGKEMKKNVMEWKRVAEVATTAPNGSSTKDLDDLVRHLLSS